MSLKSNSALLVGLPPAVGPLLLITDVDGLLGCRAGTGDFHFNAIGVCQDPTRNTRAARSTTPSAVHRRGSPPPPRLTVAVKSTGGPRSR